MRTGFVGLGAMGSSMARNLHRAGLLYGVWNRTGEKARALAGELQCAAPEKLSELAQACDVLVLCVSADADVLAVVAGLSPAVRAGTIVIDCSTVSAETARRASEQSALARCRFPGCTGERGRRGRRQGYARHHGWRRCLGP